jgi:hypothetical protein
VHDCRGEKYGGEDGVGGERGPVAVDRFFDCAELSLVLEGGMRRGMGEGGSYLLRRCSLLLGRSVRGIGLLTLLWYGVGSGVE